MLEPLPGNPCGLRGKMAENLGKSEDRTHQKLVTVYTAANSMEARMVQELLAQSGIESMLHGSIGETLAGIYGMTSRGWSPREIQVLESDAKEATRILSELPAAES